MSHYHYDHTGNATSLRRHVARAAARTPTRCSVESFPARCNPDFFGAGKKQDGHLENDDTTWFATAASSSRAASGAHAGPPGLVVKLAKTAASCCPAISNHYPAEMTLEWSRHSSSARTDTRKAKVGRRISEEDERTALDPTRFHRRSWDPVQIRMP